jgi:hypothetical protein
VAPSLCACTAFKLASPIETPSPFWSLRPRPSAAAPGVVWREMPRGARPQPVYAPENEPRAASTSSASSIRTRQNVRGKAQNTIMVYNLTFRDQSRNTQAARIYAGMIIRER